MTIQMMTLFKTISITLTGNTLSCHSIEKNVFIFNPCITFIWFLQKSFQKSWTGNRKLIGVKPKPRHYGISTKMFYYILLYLYIHRTTLLSILICTNPPHSQLRRNGRKRKCGVSDDNYTIIHYASEKPSCSVRGSSHWVQ